MRERVSRVVAELLDHLTGEKNDLARASEVSYASLHAWRSGRRAPSRENALKLAAVARERAQRISELAGLLARYGRTGELDDQATPDRSGSEGSPRLDRRQLREIQKRARQLQEKAGEGIEWIQEAEVEHGRTGKV